MTPIDLALIPYGAESWPPERLAQIHAGAAPGLPLAEIRRGAMLRINSGALDLPPPPPTEADSPMAARIAAHLKRLCGGWNKAAAHFLERYFAFLDRQIAQHRAEIEARLAPFEGLFRADDFLYSAPLPLPQAYLAAPAAVAPAENRAPTPADFVKADFALWLGDRLVAVLLAPTPLTPMSARRRRERLETAGIMVTDCSAADLDDAAFAYFAGLLGPDVSRFWESETLPSAPVMQRLGF